GSPWKGKEGFGEQGRYPLGGIVLFHRATDNRIERIAPNEALSALTAATPIPKDAAARLQTLTRLHDITQQTPLFTLFADKHPDAVRAVLAEWEDLT
ncbi:MAG: hypothetical protein IKV35_06655, partial [Clostridia bacterium]|nr:hypothetical protein [Clostridia bacterium]